MTKRLTNWIFRDVESFLKEKGFKLNYTNASHFYYIGHKNGILRNVCVPFPWEQGYQAENLKRYYFTIWYFSTRVV